MFIDEVVIKVLSGKGGDGMVHFHREKYVARGGPDGGDGGHAGAVILEVLPTMNTLSTFRHQSRYKADDGRNGGPNNMTGRSAKDLIIHVPPGTIIHDLDKNELLGDLTEPGQQLRVCKGGRGGRGNARFATARNQAPRIGERGEPGEEKELRLELKLIADIGIVGLPNAGKSSLLTALTNARPKIGDYPFTTLEPNLGVMEVDDEHSAVLADIPGLIEGAHKGVGLGDAFLKHIQRTRVLVHMLDGSSPDPMADLSQINSEMALFDTSLAKKNQVVVVNKMDLPEVVEQWPALEKALKKLGHKPMLISAMERQGLEPLKWRIMEELENAPAPEPITALPVYKPEEDPREYSINRKDDGWQVRGAAIERAAAMTYWEHDGSVRRFQRLMETIGLDKELRELGIQNGDTVFIGKDYELEWQD